MMVVRRRMSNVALLGHRKAEYCQPDRCRLGLQRVASAPVQQRFGRAYVGVAWYLHKVIIVDPIFARIFSDSAV